ncbi:hypothetical protein ACL02U_06315 [Streptomyces sp. MS06]|uniref:hypothetical protein n=1 Tax=Streptomyces sp. MS06 TaxID=3385974 RepID=UPI0039A0FAA3
MVLLKRLPRDSEVNRELYGEANDWSVTDHLLAAAVDHLAAANWMFACVNTGEDDEPPEPPEPVPRPGEGPEAGDDGDGGASGGLRPGGGAQAGRGAASGTASEGSPGPDELRRFFA